MGEEGPTPRGKVARLLRTYGMEEFGDYLVERWTTEDAGERLSLRALAREFNVRLLQSRLTGTGAQPVRGEAANFYESLRGDTASRGEKTQTRRTLEQRGVDVDALENEFVSRQAIHTYLTKARSVSQGGRTRRPPPRRSGRPSAD